MTEKKGDPTYVRFKLSTRKRIQILAQQFGDNVAESDIIEWLTILGLDTYEFHTKHFTVFPIGLNLTTIKNGKEDETC